MGYSHSLKKISHIVSLEYILSINDVIYGRLQIRKNFILRSCLWYLKIINFVIRNGPISFLVFKKINFLNLIYNNFFKAKNTAISLMKRLLFCQLNSDLFVNRLLPNLTNLSFLKFLSRKIHSTHKMSQKIIFLP